MFRSFEGAAVHVSRINSVCHVSCVCEPCMPCVEWGASVRGVSALLSAACLPQILVQGVDWVPALCKIASPGIKESGLWDSLDRTQVSGGRSFIVAVVYFHGEGGSARVQEGEGGVGGCVCVCLS